MTSTDVTHAAFAPEGIDPQRWPDVAAIPHSSIRAAVARRLFRHATDRLPVRIEEAGRAPYGGGGPQSPVMRIARPHAFFHRVGASGTIGFGESFMAGDWTADDLAGVLTAFALHIRELIPAVLQKLRHAVLRREPESDDNTIAGARTNISHHYDLSNELFKLFLDESLTYSSALFAGDPAAAGQQELREAQGRKIERLLDVTEVRAGSRLLEIGSGWGELAIRAAKRGATVTTITLSEEQAALARQRIAAEGLSGRASVELCDYRQTEGRYDAVVSIEMIEAVGFRHWPEYFGTVDQRLVPGGRFGLQAITQDDVAVQASRETYTWTRKYIFPGGQLPSVESIARTVREHTSLRVADRYMFGLHYAETLRRWRERFEARASEVGSLGFDATFRRMWSLYLAYSEAGFRSGYLDVNQFVLAKNGVTS
jgi:cyclopropane-fatty-acyl-phospholipid synthase